MDSPAFPLKTGTGSHRYHLRNPFVHSCCRAADSWQIAFGTGTAWYKDDVDGPINPNLIETLNHALSKGFVHVDCADNYGTEREARIAIKESGIPRDKLFITTKVKDGWADVRNPINASLERLQSECVDLNGKLSGIRVQSD